MDESYEFFYDYLSNGLFKIFMELYQDSKKIKSPYNHLKNFQLALGETVKWTDVVYENKWEIIARQSNCDYFNDYLKIIFYTKLKYLIENCILDRQSNNLNLSDYIPPTNIEFLKKVTIYSAKEFYKNPYLFDDKNINSKRIVKNRELIKDIISKSIRYVIQLSLPTKSFVNHYDPNELIKKVNELTSMNNLKTIGVTQNQTEVQTTLVDNTKKLSDNTNKQLVSEDMNNPNELIKLYQTMLLNQLVQQQQQLNLQNSHMTLKQHTLNETETTKSKNSDSESDKNSDSESSEHSNEVKFEDIKKNNNKNIKNVLTNKFEQSESESEDIEPDSVKYIDEDSLSQQSDGDSETQQEEKVSNNLAKEHLLRLNKENNIPSPENKKENNPTIVKVIIDDINEIQSNNIKSIINDKNIKKNSGNNELSSQTQKEMAKYTSNKYKKQLKEMNNKLKKVNSNPKINVKDKVEMSPLYHKLKKNNNNQQKLNDNDDFVDIHSINQAKKLANKNHQKTQLDIIKSISVASKHTNFQSLSDNENSTLIQEKLKSEIEIASHPKPKSPINIKTKK